MSRFQVQGIGRYFARKDRIIQDGLLCHTRYEKGIGILFSIIVNVSIVAYHQQNLGKAYAWFMN